MKSKKKLIIFIVIMALTMFLGTTYSWLTWSSENDKVLNITIGNVVNFEYKIKNEINTTNLAPVFDYLDGELIEFSLSKNNLDNNNNINIYLYINSIDEELKNSSFKYILLKENIVISEGNFENTNKGEKLYILTDEKVNLEKSNYKLYVYIDGNIENTKEMMNKKFNALMNIEIKKMEEKNNEN